VGLDRARGRGRGLEVAEPPISALSAANQTVGRGYYAPTTLSAVDADLASANIKNGITIFGFAGSADVHDISDATAIEGEVIAGETFYAVSGGIRTGTMPIVALAAGANAYPAGYHVGAASLTAVDGDLVTGSIKFGITIFGVAGHTNVRDVSDANALIGEVMAGRTFYAVGGAKKTGTLPTQTLNPANENVLAGYYATTTLSAVDIHLAAANIKSGITIFGFTGPATVQDIADADAVLADVKAGKTFYSVTGARKTGNLATVALDPALNAYPAGYHVGAASLTAVDAQLVAANIANGIVIFGVTGTLSATLAEDLVDHADSAIVADTGGVTCEIKIALVASAPLDYDLATITKNYDASSMAVGVAQSVNDLYSGADATLRLYMDGVLEAESAAIGGLENTIAVGTRALSGSKICKASMYIRDANRQHKFYGAVGGILWSSISVGSIKAT